MKPKY